ncbi:MAG TPA: hypothetical protein VK179_10700 [Bacteroidales bacterium]|nr:hypothetical protein [Bacteroidales bacterium]
MIKEFLIFSFLFISLAAFSQNTLPGYEAQVVKLYSHISPAASDEHNKAVHDSIADILNQVFQLPNAFEYPFTSIKFMGKITSEDKKVRVITWNWVRNDATNLYYGFVIHRNQSGKTDVFRLTDKNETIAKPAIQQLDAGNWPGCLVYEIVQGKADNQYLLLGYDPRSIFISRKIIDVLWFQNDIPFFGKPIFHTNGQTVNRIIFEYSAKVRMSLTWNKRMNMIVFDHLASSSPSFQGNYQYYGPDLSFDGLSFDKGVWELRQNVDVRN